ncbi:MAG: 23S rRNA (uracil(1939)-C(5))-methyltransferase RlmD [Ruminococcus sp.]
MTLKKNDKLIIDITGMTSEGYGVGKSEDGVAIFVPNSAVGDRAEVLIVKVLKNYCFGKLINLVTPSPDRCRVDCPVFLKCGGCCYRHITYDAELKIKEQKVRDAIARIAGLDVKINPVVGAENPNHYRNKAQFPLAKDKDGNILMGFYGFHSHRVVDTHTCLLQPKIFDQIMEVVRNFLKSTNQPVYDEITHKGLLRHLYIRYGEKTGEIMVCLVVNGEKIKAQDELINSLKENIPAIKSVIINSNKEKTNVIIGTKNRTIFGENYIVDNLCGLNFRISPNSFYQVNHSQAERLYNKAKEYANLSGEETLVDLYCGTGTIGLTMARDCKRLVGVEIVPQAIKDAKLNAQINGITNAEFICGDATKCADKLKNEGVKPDVVVVDPPRKGLTPELIRIIKEMSPKRVVYVSCDPGTLARDLKIFEENKYSPQELTPFDLFPRTSHVECVVMLTKV